MFKDKGSEEVAEIKAMRHELNNPKVETEEKELSEEESLEWLVGGINKRIRERVKEFFKSGRRKIENYNLNIDNKDGEVLLEFSRKGKVVHTEKFKA